MWRHGLLATVTTIAIALAGCSSEAVPPPSGAATATPLPTATTTTYPLRATAWYAGLIVHLDEAVSVMDERGGVVSVEVRLENPGEDLVGLDAPILLAAGGRAVEPARGTLIPDVPARGSAATTIQFDVDGAFELARAAIRIGRAVEHVVVIPLIPGSQNLVVLEPLKVDLAGSATVGQLTVTLAGAELRADLPDWGLELAHDTLALTVTYMARYRGTFSGGFAFTGANIGLRLPDGSIVAAREDGHSQSVSVLLPGVAAPGLIARFDVPTPGSGTYALIIRDGKLSVPLAFTIEVMVADG